MCKRLVFFVSALVLSLACTSQALVIGNFEGGFDNWQPAGASTLTLSTVGATNGTGSLLIEGPGSWQMLAKLDAKSLRGILGVADSAVSIDVTAFAADMATDWMNMEVIINGQNNDSSGANNNIGWQSLGAQNLVRDGTTKTMRWEVPDDLSAKIAGTDDNIQWFELFIVTNNGAAKTKIYIDNIQLFGTEAKPPASKAKVVWVSFHGADNAPSAGAKGVGFTEAPDKKYTDLLTANGYEVTRFIQTGTPDVNVLNAADLVIVSRSCASGSFQNAAATTWNTKVTAPIIYVNGYLIRKSRLGFATGNTIPDTTGDIALAIPDPNHPIFAGIPLLGGTMVNPYAGIAVYPTDGTTKARGISIVTDPMNAAGKVLATVSAAGVPANGVVIAEWPAGATLTHDGGAGTDVLAGPRLVFLTGAREASGKSSETAGMYDLYADGEQMFLNAVKYMIPVKDNNLLANGGFEDGVLEPWATYGNATTEVVAELVGATVPEAPAEGKKCLHVTVPAAGANFWDAGLQHPGHVFKAGKKYKLSVWLKCKTGTLQINLKPELAADPWTGFGDKVVTITDKWAEYSVTTPGFTQDTSPGSITLHIAFAAAEFWVDGARLIEEEYVPPPGGANELTNGNFEEGPAMPLDTWAPLTWNVYGTHTMEVVSDLAGAVVPEAPIEGKYCLHVTVPQAPANFWEVGLQHIGHTFKQGKKYTLSVWFKSKSGPLKVNMKPELGAAPWSGFGEKQITMTEQWAEYSTTTPEFAQDTTPGTITFHIGFAVGDFWVDNVRWYEGEYVAP